MHKFDVCRGSINTKPTHRAVLGRVISDLSVSRRMMTLRACKTRRRQNQEQLQLEVLPRQYPKTKIATE
jgi:hypothetical protein